MNGQKHIDQRSLELLNGGIDGELNADDLGELDQLLSSSEKLRDLHKELESLSGELDNLPEMEPPQYLQESIERQIRLPQQSDQQDKKRSFFGSWLPTHWMRTGFALTAGAVLTISVYEMGSRPMTAEDVSNLSGSIVSQPIDNRGQILDSIHVFTDSLTGSVELRSLDDMFTLDVQLTSEGPTQLVIDFSDRGLEFAGVTRMQDRQDAVSVTDGTVNIASNGEQRYTMSLRQSTKYQGQSAAPLELDFFANQLLVHEAQLSVTQK